MTGRGPLPSHLPGRQRQSDISTTGEGGCNMHVSPEASHGNGWRGDTQLRLGLLKEKGGRGTGVNVQLGEVSW